MDAHTHNKDFASAGAHLPSGADRRGELLDAGLAFLLALAVLGGVWWYAA